MPKWCTRKIGLTEGSTPGSTWVSTHWVVDTGFDTYVDPAWAGKFPPSLFWLKFDSEFEFELFSGLEFSETFIGP